MTALSEPTPAKGLLARIGIVVRRIIGAPDYERYVGHVRRCHPEQEPLSRADFYNEQLEDRYSRPGSRCC
jgi:uncharacterized short protein YbdD (DUF466 family)